MRARALTSLGLLPALVTFVQSVPAQDVRSVTGIVRALQDSTPVQRVRVRVLGTNTRAETDSRGRFVLRRVPRVTVFVAFERLGVASDTVRLPATRDALTVFLRRDVITLTEVVSEALPPALERFREQAQTSMITLDAADIRNTPTLLEPDVMRTLQLMPGAVARNDFSVGINVRGGETDQNLILLDGATVFNPSHLAGLFSTFDQTAVGQVDFITGGFPAGYGGRLSSVIDVALRTGDPQRMRVGGEVSLLSSKLRIEGPAGSSGATYLLGARRTYIDAVVSAVSSAVLPYYFTDVISKVTVPVGAATFSATGYWGRDNLSLNLVKEAPGRERVDLGFDWGNRLVGLNLRLPLGEKVFEQHLSVSGFTTTLGLLPSVIRFDNSARVLTARSTLALSPYATHDVRVGMSVEDYVMSYGIGSADFQVQLLDVSYRPTIWSAFVDNQWRASDRLLLRPGVRLEYVTGADYSALSPRIAFKAFLSENQAITGSAGRYHQAIHSIRDQEQPITLYEFWIGADEFIPVARSDQVVLGFERWFGTDASLRVEGYYKNFNNLVTPNRAQDLRVRGDEFIPASGYAWGADLMARRYTGRLRWMVSYGFTKAMRRSEGRVFPPGHDRRHTLNIMLQGPGPFGGDAAARWGYGSPLPYTGFIGEWKHRQYSVTQHRFVHSDEEPIGTDTNGERYPYYARFDFGFRWQFEKWGGTWHPYVHVVNVNNRQNVFLYFFDFGDTPPTRTGVSQLPFLPAIGVEFEW